MLLLWGNDSESCGLDQFVSLLRTSQSQELQQWTLLKRVVAINRYPLTNADFPSFMDGHWLIYVLGFPAS
jgi:hypothetical protein